MVAEVPAPKEKMDDDQTSAIRQESMDVLDGPRRQIFSRAIARILHTEEAEVTYAQIVDGLPLCDVANDRKVPGLRLGHPMEQHKEFCPGVLAQTRLFRETFDPDTLKFDARIAVILFGLDTRGHKDDGIGQWAPPKTDVSYWRQNPNGPYPTLFAHRWYKDHGRYPNGIADAVGYWAEDRIFGGVVQFDRRPKEKWPDADPDAVYLHPDRRRGTYRIFKIFPEQRRDLLHFLTSDSEPPPPNVLPILATNEHITRVDPEESSEATGIFRDIWERAEIPADSGDARLRTVWDSIDYPTLREKGEAIDRAKARQWRIECSDDPDGYWRDNF